MYKAYIVNIILLLVPVVAFCQQTVYHTDESSDFKQGLELFNKEKYTTAQQLFVKSYEANKDKHSSQLTLTQFYIAQCAVQLFNADAEFLTHKFISENPNSPLVNEAYLNLGGFFYAQKKWVDAIKAYGKSDWRKLNNEQQAELFFKKGYSYFMRSDKENAKMAFYEIKDKKSKFQSPALYYYSHIHYKEKNYQTALNGFLQLTDDKSFGPIVPYYVVQIYYMQKKYTEITDFVPGIIDNVTEKRLAEISRIAAESYFHLLKYEEAIAYFSKYMEAIGTPAPEASYQLAYSYYKTGKYAEAIEHFKRISLNKNELGQNASYYLASCYLNVNDKENARKAFGAASRSDFDPAIKQDALFNYALLTYEVGNDPFNDGIQVFEEFINTYPESKRINEARRFLIQAYLGARNYKKALASIDRIKVKNDELKEAYQRIAFNRGLELYSIMKYAEAAQKFKASLKYKGFNAQREARALFWLGESRFGMREYKNAITSYKTFKKAPVAHTTAEFKLVDYNMAYAFYKIEDYASAAKWFRQFASNGPDNYKAQIADALLRVGDCNFMQGNYYPAIDFYQRAMDKEVEGSDYAMFQKAMCQGLAKKELDKINTLKQLTLAFPTSHLADDAFYEIAQEYLKLQDNRQAIQALTDLYNQYQNSEIAGKALVQLGLLYYNADNNNQAIKYYKIAVSNYPGTQESRDALLGLKNIYIDLGRIEDYSSFVDGLSGQVPRLSVGEKDSLSYAAAEKHYLTGNCTAAQKAFKRYIGNYPNGAYLTNAYFYSGDCYYQAKDFVNSLAMFKYVIQQPENMYTEQALLGSGRIARVQKNYDKTLEYYEKLVSSPSAANVKEAKLAVMNAYFAQKKFSEAEKSAKEVLTLQGIGKNDKRKAKFIQARSLQENGRVKLAIEAFRGLSQEVLSNEGAESKYRLAQLLHIDKQSAEAEKIILDFSSKSTSHEYWMARSFLLWADIFVQNKNYFQATETVQSIIDYYAETDDGILQLAKAKKAEISKLSQKSNEESELESVEVNIENKN